MLLQISTFVEDADLLMLRLVCRTVASASFDTFAERYLKRLTCFFPNPSRIRRVLDILASDSLGYKVRFVRLTLNPLESKNPGDFHLAINAEQTIPAARWEAFNQLRSEQTMLFKDSPLGLDTLSATMNFFKDRGIIVKVDYHRFWDVAAFRAMSRSVIDAITDSGCLISTMCISEIDGVRASDIIKDAGAVCQGATRLVAFQYCGDTDDIVAKPAGRLEILSQIIAAAEKLKGINIWLRGGRASWVKNIVYDHTRGLLLANKLDHLESLILSDVCLALSDFLEVFNRARDTLAKVELIFCYIIEENYHYQWDTVMQCLRDLPKLKFLKLNRLFQSHRRSCLIVCIERDHWRPLIIRSASRPGLATAALDDVLGRPTRLLEPGAAEWQRLQVEDEEYFI